ncbi:hypothetical protein LINPERPRIM_LOCUS22894 [Linum perenne]
MSVPIATYDDKFELEDNQTNKKQKKEIVYYPINPYRVCKCCQELENRASAPMPDLNEYLYQCDEDDEEANLRIARYYKKWIKSGGFDVDCPPYVAGSRAGFIYNKEHFVGHPNYDTMLDASVRFGIETCNQETGNQMKLLQIMNVSVGKCRHRFSFFLTLKTSVVHHGTSEPLDQGTICNVTTESSDPVDQGTTYNVTSESSDPVDEGRICNVTSESSDPVVGIYEAVVSYDIVCKSCQVLVFRRKSDGKDLIKPNPTFAALTRSEEPVSEDTKMAIQIMMPFS